MVDAHYSARYTFVFFNDCSSVCGVDSYTGQSGSLQDLFNGAYKGKTLLLRNFYSDSHLKYDQNGILLSGGRPGSWTLAYMEIKVVTVSTQGLEVLGNRVGAVFQNDSKRPVVIGRLQIDIARPASNMDTEAAVLPTVSKIFIDPEEDHGQCCRTIGDIT